MAEKKFHAEVMISFKESVLDPQGQVVEHALENLGLTNINNVRVGKWIQMAIIAESKEKAEEKATQACEKLLVNKVIEAYRLEIKELKS